MHETENKMPDKQRDRCNALNIATSCGNLVLRNWN